ncbi:MAG: site-specific integrase, partial [Bacteroidetes bacterium]|nr:site-specific integrase [Bacteroidota bacterium]
MSWKVYTKGFRSFLLLERSLSENSIEAYLHDVEKLVGFLELHGHALSPKDIQLEHLQKFLQWVTETDMSAASQARIISGIKSFYKYLLLENVLSIDPTALLEAPKLSRKLPDTLNLEEINALIGAIDLSGSGGQRNKAMLETLYSCGLRVSELVGLKISNLFFKEDYIKVTGK